MEFGAKALNIDCECSTRLYFNLIMSQ